MKKFKLLFGIVAVAAVVIVSVQLLGVDVAAVLDPGGGTSG